MIELGQIANPLSLFLFSISFFFSFALGVYVLIKSRNQSYAPANPKSMQQTKTYNASTPNYSQDTSYGSGRSRCSHLKCFLSISIACGGFVKADRVWSAWSEVLDDSEHYYIILKKRGERNLPDHHPDSPTCNTFGQTY